MSNIVLVEQLQAYLIAQGVGQAVAAEPSVAKPSIWTMPRQGGAPMPRMKGGDYVENVTVTLNDQNLAGPPGAAEWLEDTFVDVTVRSLNPAEGKLLHRTIAGLLAPVGVGGGKKHWVMGELLVQESRIWRREQALPAVGDGKTYDRVASYQFRVARSTLAA